MTLTRIDLHGFVPAIVTPFDREGAFLEADFRTMLEALAGFGATAICVAGDNGESWTLSVDERRHLTAIAVDQLAGRLPVITGVSAPTAAQSIAYARAAEESGAAAVLAMPQTYVLKATRTELVARFARLADASPLPIVAYNSPRRAGIELGLDDLDRIMEVAPIIGIKESHRDFFHLTHLIERFADRIAVMVGPSHYILPGLALGAAGFIATGPELLGSRAGQLVELARSCPGKHYADTHFQLTGLYETLMGIGTWPASIKAALQLIGLPAGVPREPVEPLDDAALATVHAALTRYGLLP